MDEFDLLGPLPAERSTTVLEASAGTGKTFALAGLVTRYVAEGRATPGRDAADHVQPGGQPGTARAGAAQVVAARPARFRRSRGSPTATPWWRT